MARGTRGANKSQAIRDYLATNPDSGPKQIVADLRKQGTKVSLALASAVKYKSPNKKPGKRGRKPGAATTAHNGNGHLALEHLLAAKKLVEQLGSVSAAKQAVDALAKLS
jgi:hypothetical protein